MQEPEKQEEVVEPVQEEIVGGYVDVEDGTLTNELKDIFNKALEDLLGATYEPQELVATQVVAGTNYKFLANGTKTTNPIIKGTYYIYIYEDLQGNVELKDIEVIEEKQEEVKTQDITQMSFWVVFYDQYGNELQREALKYGTVPEYKTWLPEGFDKWVYKKSGKDVGTLKAITGNTYYQAVCHEVEHEIEEEEHKSEPVPTQDPIKYLAWNGSELVEKETRSYSEISNSTTTLSSGFYIVNGEVTTGPLTIKGSKSSPTYIILCDGSSLNVTSSESDKAGINVNNPAALIITTPKDGTGTLESHGGDYAAGIGSDGFSSGGFITINGGTVNAFGGTIGAGIGSGECGTSGTITINGGTITATGNSGGAGIGAGGSKSADNITINGGTITATAGLDGAGIGGGSSGEGGNITINGGTITASAGSGHGSGIGYGGGSSSTATVLINGGTITTTGGDGTITDGGPGIGGTTTVNGGTTTITGGTMMPGINGATTITGGTTTITAGNRSAAIVGNISISTFGGNIYAGDNDSAPMLEGDEITNFVTAHNQRYVKFEEIACLARGTMITMADGSRQPIEDLYEGDLIRVFDHNTGEVSNAKIMDYWQYKEKKSGLITLHFTNDIDVNIVTGHSFYNEEENKYVLLNACNVNEYIGKHFYNVDNNSWETLLSTTYSDEKVDTFYIATENQFDCVAEGMLNVEDGIYYLLRNTFDFDENMKVDQIKKSNDIKKYGLFDNSDFEYLTEEAFEKYGFAYLKVSISKGIINESVLDVIREGCLSYESENIVEEYIPENIQHSVR